MKNRLIEYFSALSPLSEAEVEAMEEGMVIKEWKKGDYLLKEGQFSLETFFILQGCVRQFYLVDGQEKTTNFFTEGQWIISLTGISEQTPSEFNLVCMEDTFMVVGDEEKAEKLFLRFPRFETLARQVMEKAFGEQQKLIASYQTSTAEQRYLQLLQDRPDIFQRVPQYHLASYIGVKPESLSRIRKRLAASEGQAARYS